MLTESKKERSFLELRSFYPFVILIVYGCSHCPTAAFINAEAMVPAEVRP